MPNTVIICRDDKRVEIDSDLFRKFSVLARTDKSPEISVDASATQIGFIKEYIEHHQKKEAQAPVGTIQMSWKIDTVFDDKWDGELLSRVTESEKDSYLIEFSNLVELLDIDILLKKVTVAICIIHVTNAGSMNPDKLAQEFNRIAIRAAKAAKKDDTEEKKEKD